MSKKINFPKELVNGKIGTGWFHDDKTDEVSSFASVLLRGKIEEAFAKAKANKEKLNAIEEVNE